MIDAFMGGLKAEVVDNICMFRPKSLKEAISLVYIRHDKLACQQKYTILVTPIKTIQNSSMKWLTRDEMQQLHI